MLSISAMGGGQGNYYLNLAREDYYLEGGEPPGKWLGRGASILGLAGKQVARAELENLLTGMAPAGDRALVQLHKYRDGRKRQPGWDLTFSAPKSVSVLWSQAPQDLRVRIQQAHLAAVRAALDYLEATAAFSRRGKQGTELSRVALIAAAFEHGTSRAQDPQLHSHLLVLNVGAREDGSFGTIRSRDFYQHQLVAGAIYRSELGRALTQDLGFALRKVEKWFELECVPQKLSDFFSKRRTQILERMEATGQTSPRAAEAFALSTREVKGHVARDELFAAWRATGREMGFDVEFVLGTTRTRVNRPQQLRMLAAKSIEEVARSQSHFTERDVLRRTLDSTQHLGFGAHMVIGVVRQFLREPARVVALGVKDGHEHFTTRDNLDAEMRIRALAERSFDRREHLVTDETLLAVTERYPTMNAEQRRALRYVTQRLGSVKCVSGMAGTGKTFMLQAAREAWEAQGYKVLGASLAAIAALGLEEASGIRSRTIAKYLREWEREDSRTAVGEAAHYAKAAVKYKRSAVGMWRADRKKAASWALDSKTVLVIDEAGMVDTKSMDRLLARAEKAGAKVVLVGDARQLQPIEAGAPFAALIEWLGAATLRRVMRQKHEWMRRAVHQFAAGDAEAGLSHYAKRGFVEVAANKDDALVALAATWNEHRTQNLRHSVMIAGTNAEVLALNRVAQRMRVRAGELSENKTRFIGEERFHVGDRVVFTENHYGMGIFNGDFGTIEKMERTELAMGKRGVSVTRFAVIRLDRQSPTSTKVLGRSRKTPVRVTVDLSKFDKMRLGYAVTGHKSQGGTFERVFVLAGGWMQDAELAYVQMSRAVSKCFIAAAESIVGEKLSTLANEMSRSRAKELAHEFALRELEHEVELTR